MRTTLTIDDSIMQQIKDEAKKSGLSIKQVINSKLELGFQKDKSKKQRKKYCQKTYALDFLPAINLDKALQLATALEDDEILRKLELRK